MYVWQSVLLYAFVNANQPHFIIIRLTVLDCIKLTCCLHVVLVTRLIYSYASRNDAERTGITEFVILYRGADKSLARSTSRCILMVRIFILMLVLLYTKIVLIFLQL